MNSQIFIKNPVHFSSPWRKYKKRASHRGRKKEERPHNLAFTLFAPYSATLKISSHLPHYSSSQPHGQRDFFFYIPSCTIFTMEWREGCQFPYSNQWIPKLKCIIIKWLPHTHSHQMKIRIISENILGAFFIYSTLFNSNSHS